MRNRSLILIGALVASCMASLSPMPAVAGGTCWNTFAPPSPIAPPPGQGTLPVCTAGGSMFVSSPFIATTGLTPSLACDKTAPVTISTATTTSIVALAAGQAIYVCSYSLYIVAGTLPGFLIEAGTGAACVTTQTPLTGTFGGIAGAVSELFTYGSGMGTVLRTPVSNALCIVSSGTTPNIQGVVNYAQF